MNISRKALLVVVMGSLVSGCRVQAAESSHSSDSLGRLAAFLVPLTIGGWTARISSGAEASNLSNVAKGLTAASLAVAINLQKPSANLFSRMRNDVSKIGLLVATSILANSKNSKDLIASLPGGVGALFSEANGSIGFGTVARNVILYMALKQGAESVGLIDKEGQPQRRQ